MVKYNTAKSQSDGTYATIKEITYAPSVWIDFAQKILFWPDRENFACEQWLRYKDPAVTWRTFSIDKMYGPTSRDNVNNLMNQVMNETTAQEESTPVPTTVTGMGWFSYNEYKKRMIYTLP